MTRARPCQILANLHKTMNATNVKKELPSTFVAFIVLFGPKPAALARVAIRGA